MLEIRTITALTPGHFDDEVNQALADGWDLVRRECFITGSDRATTFYAELERIVEEAEEEEGDDGIVAEWTISRDPHYPFKCTNCGCKSHRAIKNCPNCHKIMLGAED